MNRSRTWRVLDLGREATKNMAASWLRTLLLLAISAGAGAYALVADGNALRDLAEAQQRFARAGGYVVTIQADQSSGFATASVERGKCLALGSIDGVVSAGTSTTTGVTRLARAPSVPIQSVEVDPETLAIWSGRYGLNQTIASEPGAVVALGPGLASDFGMIEGDEVSITEQRFRVAHVLQEISRNPRAERWIVFVGRASDDAQQCWIEFEPQAFPAGESLVRGWFASAGPVTVTRLAEPAVLGIDPAKQLAGRPEGRAWMAAGLVVTGSLWLTIWFRRSEMALYQTVGTSKSQLLIMYQLEAGLVALVGALGAATWVFATSLAGVNQIDSQIGPILLWQLTAGAATVALLGPLPVLLSRDRLAEQLKDR